MSRPKNRPPQRRPKAKTPPSDGLRGKILSDFATLNVPLDSAAVDAALARAERDGLSHLQFLQLLIGEQAAQRRERSIARRIREACFREPKTLATFDWQFNAKAINRAQIEELATGEFIRRRDNLILAGQSGVGKSHIIQAVGHQSCVNWRVRYTTSADLILDLRASLADQTLPACVRYYARFDLLIIDEFGFERLERLEAPQATSLLYKVIDARHQQRSTALVTNVDSQDWHEYFGDRHLTQALLDRLVDGAITIRIAGKSYRAHRRRDDKGQPPPAE